MMSQQGGDVIDEIGRVVDQMITMAGPEQVLQFLSSAVQGGGAEPQPQTVPPPQGGAMPAPMPGRGMMGRKIPN
jgi:hypothetical protein